MRKEDKQTQNTQEQNTNTNTNTNTTKNWHEVVLVAINELTGVGIDTLQGLTNDKFSEKITLLASLAEKTDYFREKGLTALSDKEIKEFRATRKSAQEEYEKTAKLLEKLLTVGVSNSFFTKKQRSRLLQFSVNKSVGVRSFISRPFQSDEEKNVIDISDYKASCVWDNVKEHWLIDMSVCGAKSQSIVNCDLSAQALKRVKDLLIDTLASLAQQGRISINMAALDALVNAEEEEENND